jgi:Fe-S-cluster-containing dehydrogenase component
MGKYDIQVATERCTGCLRCQLACSELYTKSFTPSRARIRVVVSGVDCSIHFTEECNGCGVCVDQCFFNALEKSEKENDQ